MGEDKKKGNPIVGAIIIGLVVIFSVSYCTKGCSGDNKKTKVEAPKTAEELRKELVEKHFSAWDGSHNELTAKIKESMNDPKSYEHVETRYKDMGEYLMISTTFRGKNAFGGVVKNTIVAKVDLDGNILEIVSQE